MTPDSSSQTSTNGRPFLIHASEDKDRFVIPFAEQLRAKGVDVWVDKWEMLLGDSLVRKIFEEGISAAPAILIVLSPISVGKPWVQKELSVAVIRNIQGLSKIIPIIIEACTIPECLRDIFHIQVQDINNLQPLVDEVVAAISGKTNKPPLGNPPTYIQETAIPISDLVETDSIVFKIIYDFAYDKQYPFIDHLAVIEAAAKLGISQEMALESMEVLDGRYYIKLSRQSGLGIDSIHAIQINQFGLENYANACIPRYSEYTRMVIAEIVNNNNLNGMAIEKATSLPPMLVVHILEELESRGLIKAQKSIAGRPQPNFHIHHISPELKRMLK